MNEPLQPGRSRLLRTVARMVAFGYLTAAATFVIASHVGLRTRSGGHIQEIACLSSSFAMLFAACLGFGMRSVRPSYRMIICALLFAAVSIQMIMLARRGLL